MTQDDMQQEEPLSETFDKGLRILMRLYDAVKRRGGKETDILRILSSDDLADDIAKLILGLAETNSLTSIQLAYRARVPSVRISALADLPDDRKNEILTDVAINDSDDEVIAAAVELIEDEDSLSRIALYPFQNVTTRMECFMTKATARITSIEMLSLIAVNALSFSARALAINMLSNMTCSASETVAGEAIEALTVLMNSLDIGERPHIRARYHNALLFLLAALHMPVNEDDGQRWSKYQRALEIVKKNKSSFAKLELKYCSPFVQAAVQKLQS